MLQYGRGASADRLARAQTCVLESQSDLIGCFAEVDVILMPTAPQTAFASDTSAPVNQANYTALANAAGCPSISIPCRTPEGGRPAGLQLMSAPGSDEKLLAWALQVERLLADC
jgi:aspartyl-tRNA(Asn)/glutamyl-tRNA(Gln) amidotransferase subunit A